MPSLANFSFGQDMLSDFSRTRPTYLLSGDDPIALREDQSYSLAVVGEDPPYHVRVSIPHAITAPWIEGAVKEALSLTQLQENWDSYGGRAPSIRVAVATAKLLGMLAQAEIPRPRLVPTSRGGIQLEWHRRRTDLEIEVASGVRARVWFEDQVTGDTLEDEFFADFAPLISLASDTIR